MHGPLLATRRWLLLTLRCRRSWPLALLVLLPLLPVDGRCDPQASSQHSCLLLAATATQPAHSQSDRHVSAAAGAEPAARPDRVRMPTQPDCDLRRIRGPPMG